MIDLTKSELAVLQMLWKQQPLSVRELHDLLASDWAYNTTKTVMDRMVRKGLLEREQSHGVYVYRASITRTQGLAGWVSFFAKRVLELDNQKVVNMFADSDLYSESELNELQRLLSEADSKTSD